MQLVFNGLVGSNKAIIFDLLDFEDPDFDIESVIKDLVKSLAENSSKLDSEVATEQPTTEPAAEQTTTTEEQPKLKEEAV